MTDERWLEGASTRLTHVVLNEGVSEPFDAAARGEYYWLRVPQMGRKGINELRALLKAAGFTLPAYQYEGPPDGLRTGIEMPAELADVKEELRAEIISLRRLIEALGAAVQRLEALSAGK